MKNVLTVIKENITNLGTIIRMSKYEDKATYQSHYLGLVWQFLNPAIQVGIYYLVFGIGVNQGRKVEGGFPFIIWMLSGIIPWFFINSSILGGSNSIYKQVGMVSKMKFPVSILPAVNMASNMVSYFAMMGVFLFSTIVFRVRPTAHWVQYIYYFICMIAFLFAVGILNATITVLVRDFHIALQSVLRLLFYISGPIWDINRFPKAMVPFFRLNPIYYIIDGFRDSFLSYGWVWQKPAYTVLFWCTILFILLFASHLHLKFRSRFVDFV